MNEVKIAISINLDWPLKRYHDLYAGIQEYNRKHANWILVWDHFPEKILSECKSNSYYKGIIGRIKFPAYEEGKRLGIPMVNTWYGSEIRELPSVFYDGVHMCKYEINTMC